MARRSARLCTVRRTVPSDRRTFGSQRGNQRFEIQSHQQPGSVFYQGQDAAAPPSETLRPDREERHPLPRPDGQHGSAGTITHQGGRENQVEREDHEVALRDAATKNPEAMRLDITPLVQATQA